MSKHKQELRHLPASEIRISKAAADGTRMLSGYGIVFNSLSNPIENFREIIAPSAVRDTLNSGKNVFLLKNHDHTQILGSTKAGNLTLATDAKGVHFTCPIDTRQSYANDLAVSVERGDTAGCSFGFRARKDSWKNENGTAIRTVEVLDLEEITITPYPCYQQTQVDIRSCPQELRSLLSMRSEDDDDGCDCDCAMCLVGDCSDCLDPDCTDPVCKENGCPAQNGDDTEDRSIVSKSEVERLLMRLALAKLR